MLQYLWHIGFLPEVLKVRLSDGKKGAECSILSPNKQKMNLDDSLFPDAYINIWILD